MKRLTLSYFLLFVGILMATADDKLPQIAITTNNEAQIESEYVNGNITVTDVDGSSVSLKAKFKKRGSVAKEFHTKPALNVKLRNDKDEPQDYNLLGLRSCSKWILDAMAIDRICMRNLVAMEIWNDYASLPYQTDFGIKNSQGNTIYRSGTVGKHVEVTINGEYKGIYVLSDHVNRKLLNLDKATSKDDIHGVLYKSGSLEIPDQSSPVFAADYKACVAKIQEAWELKEPEHYECSEAWQPLLHAMNSPLKSGKGVVVYQYNQVKKYFYIDNLVDYQLLIMALSLEDNWGKNNNYFLSIRNIQKNIDDASATEAEKRKFYVSPWDMDTALGGHFHGNYFDGFYGPDWSYMDAQNSCYCFPFYFIQATSDYQKRLAARWDEIRKTTFWPDNVCQRLDKYCSLLVNSGAWKRQEAVHPNYVDDLQKEVDYIKKWYYKRYSLINNYFGISAGITDIYADHANNTNNAQSSYYSLDGRRLSSPTKGVNIIRQDDGSYHKVVIK